MLVLARQRKERLVLPTVPATIEVVAIKPNAVRLGIDAPAEVTVLREEVMHRRKSAPRELPALSEADADARLNCIKQSLGNRLQTVALGLGLILEHMGNTASSELPAMLQRINSEVLRLDRQLQTLLSDSGPRASDLLAVSPCAVVEADDGFSI
jgi:carbon storage regulator CsrA